MEKRVLLGKDSLERKESSILCIFVYSDRVAASLSGFCGIMVEFLVSVENFG